MAICNNEEMIYLFERIPTSTSSPSCIKDAYAKIKIDLDTVTRLDSITAKRQEFYTLFQKLEDDKNFLPKSETFEAAQAYLWASIDLLEVGVLAHYNFNLRYAPFLTAGRPLAFAHSKHSALLVEYVLSRYVYSLGTVKFLKKSVQSHLKKAFEKSDFQAQESKEIIKIFKIGFLRLAKTYKNKNLIWVS